MSKTNNNIVIDPITKEESKFLPSQDVDILSAKDTRIQCNTYIDCPPGFRCTSNICFLQKDSWKRCLDDVDCKSGFCMQQKCFPIPRWSVYCFVACFIMIK